MVVRPRSKIRALPKRIVFSVHLLVVLVDEFPPSTLGSALQRTIAMPSPACIHIL